MLTACPTNVGTGLELVLCCICRIEFNSAGRKSFKLLGSWVLPLVVCMGEGQRLPVIYSNFQSDYLRSNRDGYYSKFDDFSFTDRRERGEYQKLVIKESPMRLKDRVGRAYGICKMRQF